MINCKHFWKFIIFHRFLFTFCHDKDGRLSLGTNLEEDGLKGTVKEK